MAKSVSVVNVNGQRRLSGSRLSRYTFTLAMALFASVGLTGPSQSAVNVYLVNGTPTTLQNDLIAGLTTQYNGTLTPSQFQPGTYSFTISSKKAIALPPPPVVSTLTVDATALLNALTESATYSYVYGWANGVDNERYRDLDTLNTYLLNCSSAPFFKASTATWNVRVCTTTLSAPINEIYQQNFSTPVAPK